MATLKYATTLQLTAILNAKKDIPSWEVSSSPVKETVGTGDSSTTIFYLDHKNIITATYDLYYGASESASTVLTETTHYTLDKDKGKITLTTAGVTLVSTNIIYAEYSYVDLDLTDSYFNTLINRTEKEVDNLLNTIFTDGTATNPVYPSRTEYQSSKGKYERAYFSNKRPIVDINSTLAISITSTDVALSVASGDGSKFPSTGTIIVGNEIITYTGVSTDSLTGLTRGVDDSDAAAHTAADEIHTTVVEVSSTDEGSSPTWNALKFPSEVAVDSEKSRIFIYKNTILNDVYVTDIIMAKPDVANRFRIRYLYGWDSIPVDVIRLCLLLSKRMIINDTVGMSTFKGRNEFRPETLNVDQTEINQIVSTYIQLPMGNT